MVSVLLLLVLLTGRQIQRGTAAKQDVHAMKELVFGLLWNTQEQHVM